ncbi:MAG: TetR/AcrR family transcriptional regulator [Pseudomonadota bacterium]
MNITTDPDKLVIEGLRAGASDRSANEAMQGRIVETAERLFRQFGYKKTTVADIADALNMSTANIYRFFASKGAITEAVTRKVIQDHAALVQAAITAPGLSAPDKLTAFVRVSFAHIRERCLMDNRMHEMVQTAMEKSWPVISAHKQAMRRLMTQIIAEGASAGEFDVADPALAAACFHNSMSVTLHPVLIENCMRDGEDVEALIGPMLAYAFRALGASRDAGSRPLA